MKITFLCCLALLFFSCQHDKDVVYGDEKETSALSLTLHTDYTEHEMALTRSAVLPSNDEFDVRIENTKAEVLRRWKYGELPSLIKVVPGSYKLVASFGSDTLLPAFDKPYYYGETKVALAEGETLDTIVPVKSAATKVAVVFDESFSYDYDDYFVEIKTTGDSLRFAKDEVRSGYFTPGELRLRFGLKSKNEEIYREFYPAPIGEVKAQEFYKMTLKAKSNHGALSGIIITTDESTIEIPVNIELPPIYLPKKAPVLNLSGDELQGSDLNTTEGVSKKMTAMITSAAGLKKLKLQTTSESLSALGWPAEVDLMNATAEQKTLFKSWGLEWSDELNTQTLIRSLVWVRFDNLIRQLVTPAGTVTPSTFKLVATDAFDQVGNECSFTVQVAPPVFEFSGEHGEGNIFAKRATYDVHYVSEVNSPVVEYLGDDGLWKELTTEVIDKGGDDYSCSGIGLTPQTEYSFRVRLGKHILDGGTCMTEEEMQIPNSGFEEWSEEMVWKKGPMGGREIYAFYPYSNIDNAWWNTTNRTTTQARADYSWYYGAYPGVVPTNKTNWTATEHLNSHNGKSLATDAHNGNAAAEIATIGWGKNNWTDFGHGCQEVTPGALYVGTYDLGTHTEKYGHPFMSRPLAIDFYYRFYSFNNETTKAYAELKDANGSVIGYGELKISQSVNTWQKGTINIAYSSLKRASSITIVFLSTDVPSPKTLDIQGSDGMFKGYGDSRHIGSVLTVDDVALIY